ncbi:DMT family transporter [Thorsellia kenyensis]|uniref:DMT family transporter n=1 Tax=Thorsellia kenyensis TaxID=1549888 RepID=A0ABV6CA94_9GAMM
MTTSNRFLMFNKQELCLIAITILWGGTFLIVKNATADGSPFFFVGLRFCIAGLALLPFTFRHLKNLTWYELRAGFFIGFAISLGYGLQTIGLMTIPSSTSAFITALYVPFVPILQWLILRKRPGIMSVVGIITAFIGLFLLTLPENPSLSLFSFSIGELLTVFSALAIALEIILISVYSNKVDSRRVTVVQLFAASCFAFFFMIPTHEAPPVLSSNLLYSALGLGLMSGLIQFVMNWAQKSVSATKATLIYAGEPVWAGIFGRLAGEKMGLIGMFGGFLILVAVLISEMKNPFKKQSKQFRPEIAE